MEELKQRLSDWLIYREKHKLDRKIRNFAMDSPSLHSIFYFLFYAGVEREHMERAEIEALKQMIAEYDSLHQK